MRHDFPKRVKDLLAYRVGFRCSNPLCRQPTVGPQENKTKSANVGVAAHITAAASNGPRFDPEITKEERQSYENGIWLCQNHAKLVDDDDEKCSVNILREWKSKAEKMASFELETGMLLVPSFGADVTFTRQDDISIFTAKEEREFSYLRSRLDEPSEKSAEVSGENSEAIRPIAGISRHWRVSLSPLFHLLWSYAFDPVYFSQEEEVFRQSVLAESTDWSNVSFESNSVFDFRELIPTLIRLELVSSSRDHMFRHKYTKKMHRFKYWIEFNKVEPMFPKCSYEDWDKESHGWISE